MIYYWEWFIAREGEEDQKLDVATTSERFSGGRSWIQLYRIAQDRGKWRATVVYFEQPIR